MPASRLMNRLLCMLAGVSLLLAACGPPTPTDTPSPTAKTAITSAPTATPGLSETPTAPPAAETPTEPATRRHCIACGASLEVIPARVVEEGASGEKLDLGWLDALSPYSS
jgi:hypothetical protein